MKKTNGFKWTEFIQSETSKVEVPCVIYAGNFFMELVLPNALKIDCFNKLKVRLDKYIKSHNNKLPSQITCTRKQLVQYESLFPKPQNRIWGHKTYPTYSGIPLIPNDTNNSRNSNRIR